MSWPMIIRVTLRSADGEHVEYPVLTFFGEAKAIAIATEVHLVSGGWPVVAASTEVIGPAPRNPDGTVGEGPPGVLEDRAEF